ncbi:polyprenyl synthetase family protein [Thermosediminibacter oceani]|uniref:Polyprenyl synthetase n=1 Tax=Thermosediminibacter oceani (strain ATCC BAA-1034 / DSM 16646 / JW/IW-1228P) TaxID=555079 RepID=D9RYP1_THEOJ|nr:polyprenyl synthetase family protein [Thermosediminibacter oceani]ADL08465.1 Polyprenyl synthetase [Thermosediminibacter oceani DSM 16646]
MARFDFYREISREMSCLEEELLSSIKTNEPFLSEPLERTIKAGGKRIRPALVYLSARFGNYDYEKIKPLAVAVELVHTATLIHDDIVDDSPLRRGISTVQAAIGKDAAVYAGDYVLARTFKILVDHGDFDILKSVSSVLYRVCEGEVRQKREAFDITISFLDYARRIRKKTALLFALSCELGARGAKADPRTISALKKYGILLGMAFQVMDDILDLTEDESRSGKPRGNDIKEGVITLPLLYALNNQSTALELRELLSDKHRIDDSTISTIIEIVKESGGIEYARHIAGRYVEKSKENLLVLEDSPARSSLMLLADYVVDRTR